MTGRVLAVILILLLSSGVYAQTDFDELDKPPEGAHRGQMLFGAYVSFGLPMGKIVDAEQEFVDESIYYFSSGIYKLLEVTHLAFSFGLLYEYMPIDHLGGRIKFKRTIIIQRSNFGPDYQNWTGTWYSDYSFYLGPALHLTTRKRWDIVLIPQIGYAICTFKAAPVGKRILREPEDNPAGTKMTGSNERTFTTFSYGAELNFTFYFSKGLFISIGADWCRIPVKLGKPIDLVNPQDTSKKYLNGGTSGTLDTVSCIITAGYAFSN